uniref:PDZ domain-containing protein n=1 Tax=Oryza rufipogon TaxID=4529 RepID=A0A0E0PHH3_ORYRU
MAPVAAEEDDVPRLRNTRSRATRRQPGLQELLRTVRGRGNEQDSKGRSHCSRSAPASPSSERDQRMKRRRKMIEADHSCEDGEEKVPEKMNEGEEEEEVSSAPSSPLHMPLLPFKFSGYDSDGQEILEPPDMDIVDAYQKRREEFEEKRARQLSLPTLNSSKSLCLSDPKLLDIYEPAKKAVLGAAKFILGLSSSIGGKPLAHCSGFLVDWDETRKKGIVMTTSDIICSKSSLDCWSGEDEYSPNAEVYVHLLDDTTVEARLIYSQTHYNLALFEIALETPGELPTFSSRVDRAQHIFMLGRDENLYPRISHGRVLYSNPYLCDRHHYMYVSSAIPEFGLGGLVIDLKGKVVGMTGLIHAFIPSSVILKCLKLWHKFRCIPRPQLGVKLWAIKFLDLPHIEMILRKTHICDGLIVKEVSEGSILEKLGVRIGDIIECLNGERIYDTIQLEELLLELCEGHFDNGNGLNSTLEMAVVLFHIRKGAQSIKKLTANVSENGEVVKRGVFFVAGPTCEEIPNLAPLGKGALREEGWAGDSHIPTADGASASVPLDQVGPGDPQIPTAEETSTSRPLDQVEPGKNRLSEGSQPQACTGSQDHNHRVT